MSDSPTSIRKRFLFWRHPGFMLLIIVLLVIFLAWKFFIKKNDDSTHYLTAIVERVDIQNMVTATGILQPHDYVDVGAQVSGQLKKLYVEIGSEVKAGDLLAEIDATVYKARVDGIRAQLLNQQAQLQDKQAQLTLANIRIERQKNLQKEDATTMDSVQAAEAAYQSAKAQINVVQAQIHQTEFSLRVEEANLTYSRIYSPISGTVASITSRQGQTLNANQQAPTIMRISDLSLMTVQAQVSEADIGKLHLNMPVYFTTLGGKEHRWYSQLNRIQPTPEVTNNVVLYNALFEVPNENRALMTQMSTQIFFIVEEAKDALVIPASAVNFTLEKMEGNKPDDSWGNKKSSRKDRPHPEKKLSEKPGGNGDAKENDSQAKPAIVQVMDERGNLHERKVVIGVSNRVQVQVVDGLKEGEKVVSGMRQFEKATSAAGTGYGGAPGATGGANAARMMR